MKRIMFVCHGNICRSPMAEFIFKSIVEKENCADRFLVSSSATSTEEIWNGIGNPVYPPAREELKKHGIDCSGKRAIQLCADDYQKYDLFLAMDSNNLRNALRILGGDPDCKVHKLLSFAGRDDDVADPWYSHNFSLAFSDIYEGCVALFHSLK